MTTVTQAKHRTGRRPWEIWRDRRGRVSALRLSILMILSFPLAKALFDAQAIAHGARPLNDLIHRAGFWALIFLGAALAVTPLRRVTRFGNLIEVRRMIGVAAFFYVAIHLLLFVADQSYDLVKVLNELARRVYLIIGSLAWLGLAVLAATSTDGMVRRIGGMHWARLHRLVYACALLALIHYFQQTKADVTVPIFAASVLAWLMGYRLLVRWRGADAISWLSLVMLAIAVSALTFIGEAVGIGIAFNVSPLRVLENIFDVKAGIRPGWQVLVAGLIVAALDYVCERWRAAPRQAQHRSASL